MKVAHVFLAVGAMVAVACHEGPEPSTAASGAATANGGGRVAFAVNDGKKCPAEYVIDDAEDNNHQVAKQLGRGGYWYTFADKEGTAITPAAGTKFSMAPGGAAGSKFAAHMSGSVGSGEIVFAGMGFSLMQPKAAYDASAYTGVSFWARIEGGSEANVRLKVPDVNTDPAGKVCKACFNDFGTDLTLTDKWVKYTVPFAAMTQLEGWGDPIVASIDKSKIYGLQWQVVNPGAHFDLWIDDVQFSGCP